MENSLSAQVLENIIDRGYTAGNFIDKGGQGAIFNAICSQTDLPVVIKLIKINQINSIMTDREIKYLTKLSLSTTNIIKLIDTFDFMVAESEVEQQYVVLVLEKMDTDLMTYVIQKDHLEFNEAKQIFRHICLAVKDCHDRGIAHLDLKPDNILLRFRTTEIDLEEVVQVSDVKLADFGHSHKIRDQSITRKIGTKYYVSPEIRCCTSTSLPYTFQADKADIFSLGVTLFTMLTGVYPFRFKENGQLKSNTFGSYCEIWESDLVDLLESIFYARRACDRPTIDRILRHRWLKISEDVISPRFAS